MSERPRFVARALEVVLVVACWSALWGSLGWATAPEVTSGATAPAALARAKANSRSLHWIGAGAGAVLGALSAAIGVSRRHGLLWVALAVLVGASTVGYTGWFAAYNYMPFWAYNGREPVAVLTEEALRNALIGAGIGTVVGCLTWMATRRLGLVRPEPLRLLPRETP
jgi:hypothetical protein